MKKIFLILFTFSTISVIAQNNKQIAVAPTKMNVFYIGVENPVDIAVSGIDYDEINISISNGSIKKIDEGKYNVRIKKPGKCRINGSIKKGDSIINLPSREFRCKSLPNPITTIGSPYANYYYGGLISKSELLEIKGINATMENFVFDLKFVISSFIVTANIGGFDESARSSGSRFTSQQKSIIRKTEIGTRIIIEGVKAIGPDGKIRKLNDIVLRITE